MNILIIFSQPWRVGGAETHVRALIAGLKAKQHRVFLAINRGSDARQVVALQQEFPELKIITIQARGANVFAWVASLWKIKNLINDEKIEVVTAQQRTAGLWAWLLHKNTGVPFTVTMHDAWHRVIAPKMYGGLFPRMVVVSRNLAERLIQDFDFAPSAITLIQNGINFASFTARDAKQAKRKLELSQEQPLLLHVSRLSSIKGAVGLTLLENIETILQAVPNAKLVIIGEGPLRTALDAKAAEINARLGQVVSICNFTDDIVSWYNAADLLIGEGRVAIEALACCTPVVAIRNAEAFFGAVTPENLPEAIEVNFDGRNWAVTPENLQREIELAFRLLPEARRSMLAELAAKMSLETMAGQYIEVFQQTAGENSAKNPHN